MNIEAIDGRVTRLKAGLALRGRGAITPVCAGEVAEWLKAHAWKACRQATVSRVRIPVSPPESQKILSIPGIDCSACRPVHLIAILIRLVLQDLDLNLFPFFNIH